MAFGLAESCITERSGRRNGNRNGLVRTIDGEIPRAFSSGRAGGPAHRHTGGPLQPTVEVACARSRIAAPALNGQISSLISSLLPACGRLDDHAWFEAFVSASTSSCWCRIGGAARWAVI